MMDKETFEDLLLDLESLGLIKVENGKIIADLKSALHLVCNAILNIIKLHDCDEKLSKLLMMDDNELLDTMILYGLIVKTLSKKILTVGVGEIESEYIINLAHVYMVILETTKIYDELRYETSILTNDLRNIMGRG